MEKQTTPSVVMEGASHHHSKLFVEKALLKAQKIRESIGTDSAEVDTPVDVVVTHSIQSDIEATLSKTWSCLGGETAKMATDVADLREEVIPKNLELASDLKEIETYFSILEENLRRLQQLQQEDREEQELELRALQRERTQERAEWEREGMEREEALLSALMSVAVSRQKMMKQLRSQSATLVSIKHLGAATAVSQKGNPKKWWCLKKHQAISGVAPKHAQSSSASIDMQADSMDLKELMKLEKRVRKAEMKKQLKALAKAEKKARKAERSSGKKEIKKTEREDVKVKAVNRQRSWHRYVCTMGCAASRCED